MFGETPKKIGRFVLKFRWAIILTNILLLVVLMLAIKNRGEIFQAHTEYMAEVRNNPLIADPDHEAPPPIFDADYHVWFKDDNPELVAYDEFQKTFSKDDNLVAVVVAKNGALFTNDNLASLQLLTDQCWTIPYVNRVDGLTNFNYTYVDDDDLLVEDFIYDLPLSDEELAEKKRLALSDPLMPHFLLSPNADITQVQMKVIIPRDFSTGNLEARAAIEKLVARITSEQVADENGFMVDNPDYNPNLEIRLSGTTMLSSSFQIFAQNDVQNLLPFMFLFIMIVLAVSIRSFWGTISPILLLATSVFFPIALFVGVFQFSLTNATMNVVQMMVAVAIADSVHVLVIFFRGLRNGLDKRGAVLFTIEKNFLPCLITSLTTSIGFFSLILQDIPPFQHLGMFAGIGTIYAFFASIYTLPAFLSILPFKKRQVNKEAVRAHESKGYEGLANFVVRFQKPIRLTALAASLIGLYFIFQIKIDNNAIKYFDEGTEFRQATEYIDQNIIGVNPMEFAFDSGEENGIYDPDYLRKLEKFQDYIGSHPEYEITYVSSIVDIVKRINKTMNGDDPDYYQIPKDGELGADGKPINAKKLIAQYMLLYQMSLPQGMELTSQIDLRNRVTRVTAFVRSISSFKLLDDVKIVKGWMQENIPSVNAIGVGVPIMFGKLMSLGIPGILKSLGVSLGFITIVLMVTFRSVKIGLFSMIPNVWPMAIVFGMIGLVQTPVNMSVAVVGMITLGIVVDDTVHFLTKYLRGRHDGKNQHDAILYAFRQVATPLIYTSLILVAGFGSLTRSEFVLNSDLGLYCTMIIVLALLADFILLPAVILKFDKDKIEDKSKVVAADRVAKEV